MPVDSFPLKNQSEIQGSIELLEPLNQKLHLDVTETSKVFTTSHMQNNFDLDFILSSKKPSYNLLP